MRTGRRPRWLSPKILAIVSVVCFVLFIVSASRSLAATTVKVKVGGEYFGSPLAKGGAVWFNGYDAESIVIRPGDTVEWTVVGGIHTVTSTIPSNTTHFVWDSSPAFLAKFALEDMSPGRLLPPGSIYEVNTASLPEGVYRVFCKIHLPGMVGNLTVTAPTPFPFVQTAIAGWGDHLYAIQAFLPDDLTVPRGTIVRWTLLNPLEPHTITGANETNVIAWDSSPDLPPEAPPVMFPMQTFSRPFNDAGTYTYFCKLHAYKIGDSWVGMVGTVHVVPYSALDAAAAISATSYVALAIGLIALVVALFGTYRTFRKPKVGAPPP